MIANYNIETKETYPCLELVFETPKELEIFNTIIGYYPYQTMEKLRIEFGNKFPNVSTADTVNMITKISEAIKQ